MIVFRDLEWEYATGGSTAEITARFRITNDGYDECYKLEYKTKPQMPVSFTFYLFSMSLGPNN